MKVSAWRSGLVAGSTLAGLFSLPVCAQEPAPPTPVVVQPGAPGQPTRTLPPSTRATLPPRSPADVRFMQGMIMHHAQAVEMTALIESHTLNKKLRSLGSRISSSQSDEIKFMKRWLATRGRPLVAPRGTATRPISDRVKETLFGILGDRVIDARALDLYAGSGPSAVFKSADGGDTDGGGRPADLATGPQQHWPVLAGDASADAGRIDRSPRHRPAQKINT